MSQMALLSGEGLDVTWAVRSYYDYNKGYKEDFRGFLPLLPAGFVDPI